MENKILKIDDFSARRFELARKRHDEEDYIGALNILRSLYEKDNTDTEVIKEIASVYMDLDLLMLAAEYWFKLLKYCTFSERAVAYNGLGTCFYLTDRVKDAGYYYEMFIADAVPGVEYDYADEREDFFDIAYTENADDFEVVYPLSKMSPEKRLELAEIKFFEGNDKESLELLKSIEKTDDNYVDAGLRIAAHHLLKGKITSAKRVINGLIRDFPNEPLLYINKLIIAAETGDTDETTKMLSALDSFDLTEAPQCVKVAMSCIGASLDQEAEKYAEKAIMDMPYSINGLFVLGVAKYNLGKFDEASENFLKVYQITDSKVAKYYANLCDNHGKRGAPKRLGYEINYPENVIKGFVDKATGYIQNFPKVTSKNLPKILEVCDWIYSFTNNLQTIFAHKCIMSGNTKLQDYFIELLLTDVSDTAKYAIVESLAYYGRRGHIAAVYGNIFGDFTLVPLDVYDEDAEIVRQAYAVAVSKMSATYSADFTLLQNTTKAILDRLRRNGNLSAVTDINAFAAVIVSMSDSKYTKNLSVFLNYFSTDKKAVNQILKLIKADNVDNRY